MSASRNLGHGVGAPAPIGPLAIILGLIGFVVIWTLYGSLAGAGLSLHGDVAEAYVWGREFRLGYNQHPPFWAWVAGLWFLVFPNRNWSFDLLAVVNSAIGLLGCWRLIGRFAGGWERRAAFTLLLLTPFYTFLCFKYNANSIFLSIWPWTLYFFIASMDSGRRAQAVWFGLTLGLGLLSKYYAVTLVGTCLAASLVHPRRGAWYRSWSPWLAAGVCGLLGLPHFVWLLFADAPPVAYIWGRTGIGLPQAIGFGARFLVSVVFFQVAVLALVAVSASVSGAARVWRCPSDRVLGTLVLAPVILTLLFGLIFELKISSNMTIGVFPLAPLLAMRAVGGLDARVLFRRARLIAAAVTAGALVAAPAIAVVVFGNASDPDATEPRQELAGFVTHLWHQQMQTQLRIVAGSDPYENAIGFYSADHPAVFIDFSRRRAPWITPTTLGRSGLLVACVRGDAICADQARRLLTPASRMFDVTLSHAFRGYHRAPVSFDIYLIPPDPPPDLVAAGRAS